MMPARVIRQNLRRVIRTVQVMMRPIHIPVLRSRLACQIRRQIPISRQRVKTLLPVGILMRPKRAFYVSQTILASLFWCVCSP